MGDLTADHEPDAAIMNADLQVAAYAEEQRLAYKGRVRQVVRDVGEALLSDIFSRGAWVDSLRVTGASLVQAIADRVAERLVSDGASSLTDESLPRRASMGDLTVEDRETLSRMRDRAVRKVEEWRGWPTQTMYDRELALIDRLFVAYYFHK